MYFRMKFALFFHFFDSWYIIKYFFTQTPGKQYVLPRETSTVSSPQNVLFRSVSVNKC